MKVIILMPLAERCGGAERLLLELMRHGRGAGVTWTVVFFEDGPLRDAVEALGVETHVVRTGRLREIGSYVQSVRRLRRLFEEQEATLVFSWMSKAHLYGGVAALGTSLPAWWYQHGIPEPSGWMDRLITLVPAQGVVACSGAAAAAQRRLWPRRPTHVVHPCVDLEQFDAERLPSPADVRRELGLSGEGPLIGLVGRLQQWKGQHVLVEAMPQVLEEHPEAHAVLVGGEHDLEPEYPEALRERIAELELEEHVSVAGYQTDVPRWMQAMDVIVHASDHEPFGMVILEAMALGKPVVATKPGGPAEIIEDGSNGRLVAYGDAPALARQIGHYLGRPAERSTIAEAAQERAKDFSAIRYARRFVETVAHSAMPGRRKVEPHSAKPAEASVPSAHDLTIKKS